MAINSSDLKERLANESQEFKHLYDTHRSYDSRLSTLHSLPYLSADQEIEMMELKKKKLFLKDQMQEMLSQYQSNL